MEQNTDVPKSFFMIGFDQHIVQLDLLGHGGASIDHCAKVIPPVRVEPRPRGPNEPRMKPAT